MNTKILVSLLVIGLTAIGIGGAMTGAFFSDTETSTGNTFNAGSIDLQLSNSGNTDDWHDGVTKTIGKDNMVPGDSTPGKLCFKNAGNLNGYLKATMSLDAGSDPDFAKNLELTNAILNAENVAPYWAQQIIDEKYSGVPATAVAEGAVIQNAGSSTGYFPTAYGMSLISLYLWTSYSDHTEIPVLAISSFCEDLTILFPETGADQSALMGKTVTVTITGVLDQNPHV